MEEAPILQVGTPPMIEEFVQRQCPYSSQAREVRGLQPKQLQRKAREQSNSSQHRVFLPFIPARFAAITPGIASSKTKPLFLSVTKSSARSTDISVETPPISLPKHSFAATRKISGWGFPRPFLIPLCPSATRPGKSGCSGRGSPVTTFFSRSKCWKTGCTCAPLVFRK